MALAYLTLGFLAGGLACGALVAFGVGLIPGLVAFSATGTGATIFAMIRSAACADRSAA